MTTGRHKSGYQETCDEESYGQLLDLGRNKEIWRQIIDFGSAGQEQVEVNGKGLPPALDLNRKTFMIMMMNFTRPD